MLEVGLGCWFSILSNWVIMCDTWRDILHPDMIKLLEYLSNERINRLVQRYGVSLERFVDFIVE